VEFRLDFKINSTYTQEKQCRWLTYLTRNCGTKQSAGTHTNTRKWIPIKNTGC